MAVQALERAKPASRRGQTPPTSNLYPSNSKAPSLMPEAFYL
jgi:hypothetical protein